MIDTQAIRTKILDLAIQGLLTEHPTEDGTGEELLSKIIAGKKGKLRGEKKHLPVSSTTPFDMPSGWAWAQLETLGADIPCAFADGPFGSNLKKEHYTTERQVRIIQLSNVGVDGWHNNNEKYTTYEHLETIKRSEVKAGNIVIAKMMPAGRAIVVPEGIADAFVLSSDCIKLVPDPMLDVNYLCYAINSKWFHNQVRNDIHGIGRERTSLSNLKRYFVPIPSVSEQQCIVAIIKKAFSLLDIIDTLQAQYADNLTVLKSKLIDAAIQGKLTEQLPEDGTAEELYQQIQAEKQALIKAGKIKKEKPLPEISADEIPFEIPSNWKWVRFSDLYSLSNGVASRGTLGGKPRPVLRLADLVSRNIDTTGIREIALSDDEFSSHKVLNGDLVFIRVNGSRDKVANAFLYSGDTTISYCDHLFCGHRISNSLDASYIMTVYHSAMVKAQIDPEIKTTAGQNTINQKSMGKVLIPLPPLPEQKRIVERVSELLAVCDELRGISKRMEP